MIFCRQSYCCHFGAIFSGCILGREVVLHWLLSNIQIPKIEKLFFDLFDLTLRRWILASVMLQLLYTTNKLFFFEIIRNWNEHIITMFLIILAIINVVLCWFRKYAMKLAFYTKQETKTMTLFHPCSWCLIQYNTIHPPPLAFTHKHTHTSILFFLTCRIYLRRSRLQNLDILHWWGHVMLSMTQFF